MDYGLASLEEAIKAGQDRGKPGAKLEYFSWKDKDRKIVRFLTDEIITADFAEWVQTNDGKTKDFMIDPDKGDFVAKYGGQTKEFGTGLIIPAKVRKMGVAVAVLREERPLPNGGTEVVDKISQVTENGVTYQARHFGIIKQGINNFWKQVIGVSRRDGNITSRDYEITRTGAKLDTQYDISPVDKIPELPDSQVVQQYYGYGTPWDENNPNRFLFCSQTLVAWAEYYSGEERAKFYLIPKAGQTMPGSQAFAGPPNPMLPSIQQLMQPGNPQQPIYPNLQQQQQVPQYQQPVYQPVAQPQQPQYQPPPAYPPQQPQQPVQPVAQPATPAPPPYPQAVVVPQPPPAPPAPPAPPVAPPAPPAPPVQQAPPVPEPPFQPTAPGAPAYVQQVVQPGSLLATEDEAQSAPSTATVFADLRSSLIPGQ